MSRLTQICVAFDQLCNAILGGYAQDTLSGRCYRLEKFMPYKALRPLIDALLWWDKDHCRVTYENELARKYSPADMTREPVDTGK